MMLIGIIPVLQHLPLYTYVVTWQTLDHFMRHHMPVFSAVLMVLYLLALICIATRWRTWFFWALLGCFALNVSEIVHCHASTPDQSCPPGARPCSSRRHRTRATNARRFGSQLPREGMASNLLVHLPNSRRRDVQAAYQNDAWHPYREIRHGVSLP
jgi:hypothetical protein